MIETPVAPEAVRVLLASEIAQRMQAFGELGLSGPVSVTPALPRFEPEELASGSGPAYWDCFVVAQGGVGMASVQIRDGSLGFAGVTVGTFSRRALEAAAAGEEALGEAEERFTASTLSSPERGLFAIGFRSETGRTAAVTVLRRSLSEADLVLRPFPHDD